MKNKNVISILKKIILAIVIGIALLYGVTILLLLMEVPGLTYSTEYTPIYYNIDDKIITDIYEITVTNIEERTKVGTSKYYSKVDDDYYTLICATIEMKNISDKPRRIIDYRPDYSIYFKLEDDMEKLYYIDTDYTEYYQLEFDGIVNKDTINPGETSTVVIVFRLDKSKYQNRPFYLNILGDTALIKIN